MVGLQTATRVWTRDGLKNIEDVVPMSATEEGDEVLSHERRWRSVTEITS